jgi:exodeoxyribonuclease VII small subunit
VAKNQPEPKSSQQPTFEEALEQLDLIVHELEEGQIGLNEALTDYERGVKLLRHCHDLLQRAERQIALLSGVDAEGNPLSTPLDDTSLTLEQKARNRGRRRSSSDLPTPPESGGRASTDSDIDEFGGPF